MLLPLFDLGEVVLGSETIIRGLVESRLEDLDLDLDLDLDVEVDPVVS